MLTLSAMTWAPVQPLVPDLRLESKRHLTTDTVWNLKATLLFSVQLMVVISVIDIIIS